MSQKLAGTEKKSTSDQISTSKKIKKLWKENESRFHNAKNSVEKGKIKSEIYDSIQEKLGLSRKQRPMIRQTVNIVLGYKPKPKTR